jgi:hypothetical protein
MLPLGRFMAPILPQWLQFGKILPDWSRRQTFGMPKAANRQDSAFNKTIQAKALWAGTVNRSGIWRASNSAIWRNQCCRLRIEPWGA